MGLEDNYKMRMYIEFVLNIALYWEDILLTNENSLYKSEQESLKEYIKKLNQKYFLLEERQIKTKKLWKILWKKFLIQQ